MTHQAHSPAPCATGCCNILVRLSFELLKIRRRRSSMFFSVTVSMPSRRLLPGTQKWDSFFFSNASRSVPRYSVKRSASWSRFQFLGFSSYLQLGELYTCSTIEVSFLQPEINIGHQYIAPYFIKKPKTNPDFPSEHCSAGRGSAENPFHIQNDMARKLWLNPFPPKSDNFKLPLQPHQEYYITQYGELDFHSFLGWKMVILWL